MAQAGDQPMNGAVSHKIMLRSRGSGKPRMA